MKNNVAAATSTALPNDPVRDQIILDYSHLIKYIAQKLIMRLPPNISFDDLFSAGVIGLMDAIDKYDPCRDNKFKTYAEFRIRGAMLDELRNQDWVPRSVREVNKRDDLARQILENQLGRHATEREVSDYLEIPLEEFQVRTQRTRVSMLSLEEICSSFSSEEQNDLENIESSNSKNPLILLNHKGVRDVVVRVIEELPEKQKLVLSLYYYEDLNLKEIGNILEVTESRVSQLHTQAIQKIKIRLKNVLQD